MKKIDNGAYREGTLYGADGPPRSRWGTLRQAGRAAGLLALAVTWGACAPAPDPEAVDEAPPPEATGPGMLEVAPMYAADGPEADGVTFWFYDVASGERVRGPTRAPRAELEAGRYRVEASLGAAKASVEVDVRAEELTQEPLVLNAGVLNLVVLLAEDGEEAPSPTFRILGLEPDLHGDRPTVTGPTRSSSFVLPEGDALARVSSGAVTVEERVTVTAGERTDKTIVLDAGMLEAAARAEDGTAVRATWDLRAGEEDIRGERERLAGPSRGETWSILLPAGEHLLLSRHDGEIREQPVVIETGERTEIEVVF